MVARFYSALLLIADTLQCAQACHARLPSRSHHRRRQRHRPRNRPRARGAGMERRVLLPHERRQRRRNCGGDSRQRGTRAAAPRRRRATRRLRTAGHDRHERARPDRRAHQLRRTVPPRVAAGRDRRGLAGDVRQQPPPRLLPVATGRAEHDRTQVGPHHQLQHGQCRSRGRAAADHGTLHREIGNPDPEPHAGAAPGAAQHHGQRRAAHPKKSCRKCSRTFRRATSAR